MHPPHRHLRIGDHPYLVSNPVDYLVKTGRLAMKTPLWKLVELMSLENLVEKTLEDAIVDSRYPPRELDGQPEPTNSETERPPVVPSLGKPLPQE